MKCPACGTKFKSLSSWPLAVGKPVICGDCGQASRRRGKWKPVLIAVAMLFFPPAVRGLFTSGNRFTADMHRTVFLIEGMT